MVVIVHVEPPLQLLANSARPNQSNHRGHAKISVKNIEGVRNILRHDLGKDREPKDLNSISADGCQRLLGFSIGIFNIFCVEFPQKACCMQG